MSGLSPEAVRFESLNDSVNKLGELMQRYENRFSYARPFTEQYLYGNLEILADLEFIPRSDDRKGYRAHIIPAPRPYLPAVSGGNYCLISDPRYGNESLMFVLNVKVVDTPEVIVPSLVWFERSHYIDDIWAGTVYMSLFDHHL